MVVAGPGENLGNVLALKAGSVGGCLQKCLLPLDTARSKMAEGGGMERKSSSKERV